VSTFGQDFTKPMVENAAARTVFNRVFAFFPKETEHFSGVITG